MEQLALFALPRLYKDDDTPEDNGSGDKELSELDFVLTTHLPIAKTNYGSTSGCCGTHWT